MKFFNIVTKVIMKFYKKCKTLLIVFYEPTISYWTLEMKWVNLNIEQFIVYEIDSFVFLNVFFAFC